VVGVREQDRDRLLADLASALTTASTDLDRVVQCAARAGSELIGAPAGTENGWLAMVTDITDHPRRASRPRSRPR
jgi:hypothetical protein